MQADGSLHHEGGHPSGRQFDELEAERATYTGPDDVETRDAQVVHQRQLIPYVGVPTVVRTHLTRRTPGITLVHGDDPEFPCQGRHRIGVRLGAPVAQPLPHAHLRAQPARGNGQYRVTRAVLFVIDAGTWQVGMGHGVSCYAAAAFAAGPDIKQSAAPSLIMGRNPHQDDVFPTHSRP